MRLDTGTEVKIQFWRNYLIHKNSLCSGRVIILYEILGTLGVAIAALKISDCSSNLLAPFKVQIGYLSLLELTVNYYISAFVQEGFLCESDRRKRRTDLQPDTGRAAAITNLHRLQWNERDENLPASCETVPETKSF